MFLLRTATLNRSHYFTAAKFPPSKSRHFLRSAATYLLVLTATSATTTTTAFAAAAWTQSSYSTACPTSTGTDVSFSKRNNLFQSPNTCRSMSTSLSSSAATTETIMSTSNKLTVLQFPCLQDNYGYLLHNPLTGETAAIDTPDGMEIAKQLEQSQYKLTHIFNTHHHWDHTGGNDMLHKAYPDVKVYGPATESIPHCTHKVQGGDVFEFGGNQVQVIDVGGHTKGHIAYSIPSQKVVFVGDALFVLGCGRMFEGTPEQFWSSLLRLRNDLSDDTIVYCAHEYTLANAKFALSVEPSNTRLINRVEEFKALREQNKPTVPTTIGLEKETNPFLRCDLGDDANELRQNVGSSDGESPVEVFAKVRAAKDSFRG